MSFAMQINLILVSSTDKKREREQAFQRTLGSFFNTSGCIAVTPKYLLISNDEAKYNGNDKSF